jgi:hypothetical protein
MNGLKGTYAKEDNYWLKIAKQGTMHEPGENKRLVFWYVIFILLVPIGVIKIWSFDSLRFYFSIVDIIANIFASVHEGQWMGKLYSMLPQDIFSYLSTNFLSLLAIVGALWTAVHHAVVTKSIYNGVAIGAILFTFTYLLPMQGVGFVMDKLSKFINEETEFTDMSAGFMLLFFLLVIENILVFVYLHSLHHISK